LSKTQNQNKILDILNQSIGSKNILNDPEDIYVYSHVGQFGTTLVDGPVSIIKIKTKNDKDDLIGNLKKAGYQTFIQDNLIKLNTRQTKISLILDTVTSISIKDLEKHLINHQNIEEQIKMELAETSSFHHWILKALNKQDGFRISRLQTNSGNDGFCVVRPFFDNIETFSSKGRLILSRGILKDDLKASPRLIESIYTCTACGQCYDEISKNTLEINNAIIKARNKIVSQGQSPSKCRLLLNQLKKEGNPFGMPKEDRDFWYEDLAQEFSYNSNKVLFWPGCNTSYRLPEIVESTAKIFANGNLDFGLLGRKEECCGLILYLMGFWEEATKYGIQMISLLKDSNLELLVTNCAGCYYAFTKIYSTLGLELPIRVAHTSQMFEDILKNASLNLKPFKKDFLWHDPCDLGRHCGVYESPRNVMRQIPGLNLIEHPLNREHTICCGAGGGLWMYKEELTKQVAHQKLLEAIPSSLEGIASGCPACILNLRNSIRENDLSIEVHDLSELVAKSI
jgi:Fe-S oxidoreductase